MPKKGKRKKGKKAAAASAAGAKAGPAATPKSQLNKAYEQTFQQILKAYENKKYARGMKLCVNLLKKYPNHGQTLAMKGLIMYNQDSNTKAQAFDLCKRGLALDMKSHVCWHVYGILYRADNNYPMAIKCYSNAIKIDKDNSAILRDLSLLQAQTRDFRGYTESRRRLLTMKPNNSENWAGYSVANHLDGKHKLAKLIIDQYVNTLKLESKSKVDPTFELSEIALYRSLLFEAMGDTRGALAALDGERAGHIVDHLGWYQKRGELLLRLRRYKEAEHVYRVLVDTNPENYDWHRGLQCCLLKFLGDGNDGDGEGAEGGAAAAEQKGSSDGSATSGVDAAHRASANADGRKFGIPLEGHRYWQLSGCRLPCHEMELSDAQVALLTRVYDGYRQRFPRVASFERIALDFTRGDAFRERMDKYLRVGLSRSVPSLFSDTKATFAARPGNEVIVAELIDGYLESLAATPSTFPGSDKRENPPTYLFALVFKAQLTDLRGDQPAALALLDQALAHTPTMIDIYALRARFYKHGGDLSTATDLMNHAREMDLQDRYINTKHVKYLFRSDEPRKAVDIASLFTKHEDGANDGSDFPEIVRGFFDMQVIWMELEEGAARLRRGEWALALKRFDSVHQHYAQFAEDQFDFHNYCCRKSTIRAYMGMIEMVDDNHARPRYREASRGAVRAYLALFDEEARAAAGEDEEASAKVAFRATAAVLAATKEEALNKGGAEGAKQSKKDLDPTGALFIAKCNGPEGMMQKAWALCEDLRKHGPEDREAATLAFDVATRLGKPLAQLRAALDLHRIAPGWSETGVRVVRISEAAAALGADAPLASLVQSQADALRGGKSVAEYAAAFRAAAEAAGTAARCADAADFMLRGAGDAAAAAEMLSGVDVAALTLDQTTRAGNTFDAAVAADGALNAQRTAFVEKAKARFPLAVRFGAVGPAINTVRGVPSRPSEGGGEAKALK